MELDENEEYLINFYRSLNPLMKEYYLHQTHGLQKYIELAEKNRKEKQMDSIKAAKERGIKFGRPILKRPKKYQEVVKKYIDGELSSRNAAEKLKISQTTFLKWFKEDFRSEGRKENEGVQSMGQR